MIFVDYAYISLGIICVVDTYLCLKELFMAFLFNVPSFDQSVRSSLSDLGINLGISSSKPNPITYSGYLNGVPVVSNQQPTVFSGLSNKGSSITNSASTNQTSDNKIGNLLSNIGSALAIGSGLYNIFNTERNYQNEKKTYKEQQEYLYKVLANQQNAIVNQADQYARIGLNPLYMSGNGMSYSSGSYPDAPMHSNIDTIATIAAMDSLKNSAASRALQKSQADLNETKAQAQSYINALNQAKLLSTLTGVNVNSAKFRQILADTALARQELSIKDYDLNLSRDMGSRYKDSWTSIQKYANTGFSFLNRNLKSNLEMNLNVPGSGVTSYIDPKTGDEYILDKNQGFSIVNLFKKLIGY